jgi:hypothetical protein
MMILFVKNVELITTHRGNMIPENQVYLAQNCTTFFNKNFLLRTKPQGIQLISVL